MGRFVNAYRNASPDAQQLNKSLGQWIDPMGDPMGPAFELRGPGEGVEGVPERHAVLARPDGSGYFAALTRSVFGVQHDGTAPGEPAMIVDDDDTATTVIPAHEVRLIEAPDGVPWLTWNEQLHNQSTLQRRVMRLAPGCVYESFRNMGVGN